MEILKFTSANLALALSNDYTSPEVISNKNHFHFLNNYLGSIGLDTKTILIEKDYISKDYLHDYATYYALCFEKYPKFCKRIHFFQSEFDQETLEEVILDRNSTPDFWKKYLGFVVVKPIPLTVMGYTVLKTYDKSREFNGRNFWGLREYKIHIFGNEVKLDSLAFQEQDSVLSACATTAIWTMLNKASADYHTKLKSPNEITKDADKTFLDGSRLFPNKGLNVLQICKAIENSGLVSEVKPPNFEIELPTTKESLYVLTNDYTKKIINAYSPIGIPLILVVSVPNGDNYGLHAITVSGFKQSPPVPIQPKDEVSWLADNIKKIYAHDDQWGPFARIEFDGNEKLNTPWSDYHSSKLPTYITNIIVPLYPKIRISYEDIDFFVLGIDTILTLFFKDKIKGDLVWDVKIEYSNNFKKSIKATSLEENKKMAILSSSLPKYIWVASCYIENNKIFDFTFDATDIKSGMIGNDFVCYLEEIKPLLQNFLETNRIHLESLFSHTSKKSYYDFLIENLKNEIA